MAVSAKQREQVAIACRRCRRRGRRGGSGELVISFRQLMAWGPSGRKIGSEVRRRLKDAGYDERWHTLDYWVDAKRQYHYTWRRKGKP